MFRQKPSDPTSALKKLQGTILFLDEVLPSIRPPIGTTISAANRLRFMRNFGRALGMRVVMAGTAANAANMIGEASPGDGDQLEGSRGGESDTSWILIQFLRSPIPPLHLQSDSLTRKHLERPLLAAILEKMKLTTDSLLAFGPNRILYIATAIMKTKNSSEQSKLIWLSGAWLASCSEVLPSPFRLRPAELVRGHVLEPALVMNKSFLLKGIVERPYVGSGVERVRRVMGPLQIVLNRHCVVEGQVCWVVDVNSASSARVHFE
jgi:hypothetical protein